MTAERIDGKAFAARLRERVAEAVPAFSAEMGRAPGLAVVLVGEDPASQIYVRSKNKATVEAGMASFEHRLPDTTTQEELVALVDQLNADEAVDGILVQLPLPAGIDDKAVIDAIDPDKDVDGFHVINAGRLAVGEEGLVSCTPLGCLMLLKDRLGDLTGLEAVVVGRADILVVAVGQPELIRGEWIKPGATVIDVGMNRLTDEEGKTRLLGDVDHDGASRVAAAITPVPGGVGPMTIAVLLRNTLVAAHIRAGLAVPAAL